MLEVNRLVHRFGGLVAVNDVSFAIGRGEIVSLIGPNGAGKTTLFNVIAGVFVPSSGTIRYKDKDITRLPTASIAELGIIRTFQITSLFPGVSTLENLVIGRHRKLQAGLLPVLLNTRSTRAEERANRDKCVEILQMLGLAKKMHESAGALPYGDQRLLEVGIALAAGPELLLLDEPAAGLNETETNGLMRLIRQLRDSGITIFLVEHDMNLVMSISDRIIALSNGSKIAEGSPEAIRAHQEVISAYLGSGSYQEVFND